MALIVDNLTGELAHNDPLTVGASYFRAKLHIAIKDCMPKIASLLRGAPSVLDQIPGLALVRLQVCRPDALRLRPVDGRVDGAVQIHSVPPGTVKTTRLGAIRHPEAIPQVERNHSRTTVEDGSENGG